MVGINEDRETVIAKWYRIFSISRVRRNAHFLPCRVVLVQFALFKNKNKRLLLKTYDKGSRSMPLIFKYYLQGLYSTCYKFCILFTETLRKYPPLAFIPRESVESYTFKNTKVSIPKRTKVWIPVYAFHHNPNIYPEPEKYNPERFDEQTKKMRHPMHYLPFGDGPRNCIGKYELINYIRSVEFVTRRCSLMKKK